ncbi:hypothetical protein AAVH_17804 [Aphelenchoides avenae]|nr:hypothetical protein AAVH_17804 [Aphelenchus avenae]
MDQVVAKCTLNTMDAFAIGDDRLEASLRREPQSDVTQQARPEVPPDYRTYFPQARHQYESRNRQQAQPEYDSDSHGDDDDQDQPRGSGHAGANANSRAPPRGTSGQGAKTSRSRQDFPQHGEDNAGTAPRRQASDLRESRLLVARRCANASSESNKIYNANGNTLHFHHHQLHRSQFRRHLWQGAPGVAPPPPRQMPPPPPRAADQQQAQHAQVQQDQPMPMEQQAQQEVDLDSLTIYLLPRLATKLTEDERANASWEYCRNALRIDIADATANGWELLKECPSIHNNTCKGYTFGQEISSLKSQAIKRLPNAVRQKAEEAASCSIPSQLHFIVVYWAMKLSDELLAEDKYHFILTAINTRAHRLLELLEGFLKSLLRNGVDTQALPSLTSNMIYHCVKIWTFCCRWPFDQVAKRRTVGPIRFQQSVPQHYSRFLRGLWDFLVHYIPRGIDERRVELQNVDGMRVVNERHVFIGDTGAAALASRLNQPSGMYLECYLWTELLQLLESAYFGHVVEHVLISMGRADLPEDTFVQGSSTYKERVVNYVSRSMQNFPHVRFYFLHAPYTHVAREAWLAHVLPNAQDASSHAADVSPLRGVAISPEWFAIAATRSTNGMDEDTQRVLDEEGNLTQEGLTHLVTHMRNKLYVDFLSITVADGGEHLQPPVWERATTTDGPPRGQRAPPVGPADLTLLGDDALVGDYWSMTPPVDNQPTDRNVAPAPRQQARQQGSVVAGTAQAQRQQAQQQAVTPPAPPAVLQQAPPPLNQLSALSLASTSTSAGSSASATPLSQQSLFSPRQQDQPLSVAPPPPAQIPPPPPGFVQRGAPPGFSHPGGSAASVQAPTGLLTGFGAGLQFQAPSQQAQPTFGQPQHFPVPMQMSGPQQALPQMGQPPFQLAAPIYQPQFAQPQQTGTYALTQQQILALMQLGLWPPPTSQ